ncbi:conserved hypothetical protein [Streptomyces sp. SPB78]|uniref:DUF2264 domain-containing protein n=1 Tax=Streptomyces sp. (strain SPB78) TaxID=591157 RepID=UPI0001B54E06|nr:DUF2264 domain-containing protein [Streptomyces sp. SPB78]EFK98262.1 conserved hypothetical protein [Streptomyces sp. SPB78]
MPQPSTPGHARPADPAAWTGRARWGRLADDMLRAVRPYASERHALIRLPGPASASGEWSDGLEGFARTFLLAAFRLRGEDGHDPHGFAEWYARGLAAGVDPGSPERWPTFAEANQAKVEAASIALALHETRPWIWDRLSERTRTQLLDWLGLMVGTDMPQNNWIWFQGVTEAFARTVGGQWRQEDLDRTIATTEEWYQGGGWYSDGLTGGAHRNHDHYNGWAMHLYPLWFTRVLGAQAPEGLAERYRERLRLFLADWRHLVGGNGAPLFQGRSLTYRWAALAPLWTGALFDASPVTPGETRGLAARTLSYFTENGALTEDGLLSLGWHRPFRGLLQVYSGPASPYWASKGFAGLLLPASHPVWTAEPEPLAAERGDFTRTLDGPGWLVTGTAADGVVRVVNHGGDHSDPARPWPDDPHYARLGYSTHATPEYPADAGAGAWEASATLVDEAGRAAHRRPVERLSVADGTGVSRSRAHWPVDAAGATWDPFGGPPAAFRTGPWLTVGSAVRGSVEVRVARVDPAVPGDAPAERVRFGGWALPVGTEPVREPEAAPGGRAESGAGPRGEGGTGTFADAPSDEPGRASVTSPDGLVSAVTDLGGLPLGSVRSGTGCSPLALDSATPLLTSPEAATPGTVYAAAVHLGAGAPAVLPGVRTTWEPDGTARVDVTWPDGHAHTVRLPAPPQG